MYSCVYFLFFEAVTPESSVLESSEPALNTQRIVTDKRQPLSFWIFIIKPPIMATKTDLY